MYENMVLELKKAADEWRANHLSVPTFETRYDLALKDAADALEEQDKMINAQLDIIKQLQKNRAEYFREWEWIASCEINRHAGCEHGERKVGMLSAIAVLTELGMKICKEET